MSVPESLEQSFATLEAAAATASRSAAAVKSMAGQLQRAAEVGDVGKIERALGKLGEVSGILRQDVANAVASWDVRDGEIEDYLATGFEDELIREAKSQDLAVRRQDDRLIAYPSILRVLPAARVLEIDRKRVAVLRPSRLVKLLLANQQRKPSFRPEAFLETLYSGYRLMANGSAGETVALAKIYDALTILPSVKKDYPKADFMRDLYALDVSGVRQTKSGLSYSLPASTGTKSSRNTLSFVSPDGETITYYAIRFGGDHT